MSYMSKEKTVELINTCLDEMYKASNPPISWKECQDKYVDVDYWYGKHVIKTDKYIEIREKYMKKLTPMYRDSLRWAILNFSPKEIE